MENWQYYGLFIDKKTRNKLIDILVKYHWIGTMNYSSKIYLDHCTLLHKSQIDNPIAHPLMYLLDSLIEKENIKYTILVSAIGISDKAMAFRIKFFKESNIFSCNLTPHITICTFNDGKPVDSNNITKWDVLDEPIVIETTLKRV